MKLHKVIKSTYTFAEGDDEDDSDDTCYAEANLSDMLCYILIPLFFGLILCVTVAKLFDVLETRQYSYAPSKKILTISFILIVMFGFIAFGVCQYYDPCLSFGVWFNGDLGVSFATVCVGMGSNLVFGFIDNAGLFFGCSYLDELFAKLPGADDSNVCAGYGNTFSDFLGSFIGTFCGMIIAVVAGIDDGPLWANASGTIIGCLLGILIPKLLVSNSANMGLNKMNAGKALLGSLSDEELDAIANGRTTMLDVKAAHHFKELDVDNSLYVTKPEIKGFLQKSMGDDWSEQAYNDVIKQHFNVSLDARVDDYNIDEFKVIYQSLAKSQLQKNMSKTKK